MEVKGETAAGAGAEKMVERRVGWTVVLEITAGSASTAVATAPVELVMVGVVILAVDH